MQPVKALPASYIHHSSLDLSSLTAAILLNLAAVPLLLLFSWAFSQLIIILRDFEPVYLITISLSILFVPWNIAALLFFVLFVTVLHELVHGYFFWYFTRERPHFGLKHGYAFAAAPEWFFPRPKYIIIGLSPLILISIASLLLAWISNPLAMPYFLLIAALNAAGSFGDMFVVAWVLRQPPGCLIKDEGDKYHAFA